MNEEEKEEFDKLSQGFVPAENSWIEMRKLFLDMTAAGFTENQAIMLIVNFAAANNNK